METKFIKLRKDLVCRRELQITVNASTYNGAMKMNLVPMPGIEEFA